MTRMHYNFPIRRRRCCDGRCTSAGGTCPAFAPGALEVYRAPRRPMAWVAAALVLTIVTVAACWGGA